MANEVGIIGQMYENRVTKKVGVLESRNEKFKTLLMRDSNGGTFNVTYSTFKSSWRKYTGDEVIQTSTQVEESKEEEQAELEQAEKVITKSKTEKISKKTMVQEAMALQKIVDKQLSESDVEFATKMTYKGGIVVKQKNKRKSLFEIWSPLSHPDTYSFRMSEAVYKHISTDMECEVLEDERHPIRLRTPKSNFSFALNEVVTGIKSYIEEITEVNDTEEE